MAVYHIRDIACSTSIPCGCHALVTSGSSRQSHPASEVHIRLLQLALPGMLTYGCYDVQCPMHDHRFFLFLAYLLTLLLRTSP